LTLCRYKVTPLRTGMTRGGTRIEAKCFLIQYSTRPQDAESDGTRFAFSDEYFGGALCY
jgi:hypothetical protein